MEAIQFLAAATFDDFILQHVKLAVILSKCTELSPFLILLPQGGFLLAVIFHKVRPSVLVS